jgi:hypothetical protein
LFQLAKEKAKSMTQSPIGGQARQDFPEATNFQQDQLDKDALPPGLKASKEEKAKSMTQSPIGGQARQPMDFPEATNFQQDQLEKDALPPGWKASKDQNGNVYYYNKGLKVTQWSRPEELKVVAQSLESNQTMAQQQVASQLHN